MQNKKKVFLYDFLRCHIAFIYSFIPKKNPIFWLIIFSRVSNLKAIGY